MKRSILRRCLPSLVLFGFLVGVSNGRLALWKDGQAAPWKVFPCPVAALPIDTQRQLQQGIRVDSMEDLDRLLENLLS